MISNLGVFVSLSLQLSLFAWNTNTKATADSIFWSSELH